MENLSCERLQSAHRVPGRRTHQRKNTERKQYLRPLVVQYWPPVESGTARRWLRWRCWAIATSLKSIKNHSNKQKQTSLMCRVRTLRSRVEACGAPSSPKPLLCRSVKVWHAVPHYPMALASTRWMCASLTDWGPGLKVWLVQVFIKLLPVGGFITIKLQQES